VVTYRLRVAEMFIAVIMGSSIFDIILFVIVMVLLSVVFVLSLMAHPTGSGPLTFAVIRRNQDTDYA